MDFEENEILSEEQVLSLFSDDADNNSANNNPDNQDDKSNKNNKTTEDNNPNLDLENLFVDNPESVGSEENNNKEDNKPSSNKRQSSPNVLSSLAQSLNEEGIIDLEDGESEKIQSVEDLRDLFSRVIEKRIQDQLNERQKRVDEALNNGIEPNTIKNYETTLAQLSSISEELISAENEQSENLRKNLIKQDYLNKGFTQERAQKAADRAVADGTDIEDAKEALENIKQTITSQYNKLREDAKNEENAFQESMKNQAATLRKEVLEDKNFFGDLELDKTTRQKVLDNLVKTVYKDPETGDTYTAIQKYEKEHKVDFLKKIGILFTLTNGFENLEGLVKGKVKKEVGKGMKNLEQALNNTARNADGSLNFMAGINDEDSSLKNFSLDI